MKNLFTTIGARNNAKEEREPLDYYATEPKATELLLEQENFNKTVWEPCCGEGHISRVLEKNGYTVISSDIVDRGYKNQNFIENFLKINKNNLKIDIITNPPYKNALEFVNKAIDIIDDDYKVAMFLKLTFLEGKERKKFFKKHPPKKVLVSSSRLICVKNGDFEKYKSSAIAYAWFIWKKGYKDKPIIEWIN